MREAAACSLSRRVSAVEKIWSETMAAKQLMYETDARAELAAGMSQLARAVKATLGPRGRNVVLQKSFGSPRITKDGVTVDKEIEIQQPIEHMGAKLISRVASKLGAVDGGGTYTATVLD